MDYPIFQKSLTNKQIYQYYQLLKTGKSPDLENENEAKDEELIIIYKHMADQYKQE